MSVFSARHLLVSFAVAALLPGQLAVRAADGLSGEAHETFQWLAGLGFPDVAQARWADVYNGRWSQSSGKPPAQAPFRAMVMPEEKGRFASLDLALDSDTFAETPPGTPIHERVGYEPRSLEADAREVLDAGRTMLAGKVGSQLSPEWFGLAYRLPQRSRVAILAFFCHRQGLKDLANDLYSLFRLMPDERREADRVPDLRTTLERDLGTHAYHQALEQMGGIRHIPLAGGLGGKAPVLIPRKEVLTRFRRIVELYPHAKQLAEANQIVAMLERMVAEDEAHPAVAAEDLAKLPVEAQVREWIFRLQDQTGFPPLPGWHCDIFQDGGQGHGDTPAHHLVEMGYPAVPQLLEALEDKRFCRVVRTGERAVPHEILTVAYCAWEILGRISCQQIRLTRDFFTAPKDQRVAWQRAAVEKWWEDFQHKGEKQWLFDALASGDNYPHPLASRLGEKWPDALVDALLLGVKRLNDTGAYEDYLRLLGSTKDKRATEFLLKELHNDAVPVKVQKTAAELLKRNGVVP